LSDRTWDSELLRFRAMDFDEKVRWLTELIFLLTMFARGTYAAGADGVAEPDRLRRFNELIHRVATFQKKIANKKENGLSDESIFMMISDRLDEFNVLPKNIIQMLP